MKLTDEYIIPFHGLKEEVREYNFDAGSEFFEFYQNPDYTGGQLKVKVLFSRKPQFIELKFNITGQITVICDRCLEDVFLPVNLDELLIVRFGEKYDEPDNNIIIIPKEDTRINIAQYIYEFAILSLPFRKVHPDSQSCNPEMIKIIEEHSEYNVFTDPRWDKLKNIKSIK